MPHVIAEYSANIEAHISVRQLVDALHGAAIATGMFPIGGLRTRAQRRDIYAVADGNPDHMFVAVIARVGYGRDAETRRRVAFALMRVLEAETADLFRRHGLGLTVEVQEIDPTASLKINNIHERLKTRGTAA